MEAYVKPPRTGMEAFELTPEGTLCQLINNVLIMSPAPTPHLQKFSKQLFKAIERLVEANNAGDVFYSPIDVYLDEKNVFQPDIVFVSKEKAAIIDWNKGIMGAPDLVVEILSGGNKKYNLHKKKQVYEAAGVKEYWVADPKTKWCEGFILENGVFKSLGEGNGYIKMHVLDLTISF